MTQEAARREVEDLHLLHLTKQFGEAVAVDDLNLTFPAGSFFALLGPSGCGKTTTLRMVAGLEEPTAGRVLIGEDDVTTKRPYERPVNTVFQSYALFPHMDIFENVAFGLRRRGIKDVDAQVQQMLALVELEQLSRRKPAQLSGGQQQRVALARALINQPDVLLLDEPLGALDLKLRRQMQIELKRIQVEVGITFIHVTHDQEEAMTMADTVAVMNHGRIEQMGAPADIYDRPETVFVANFLGQSNLIPASVVTSESDNLVVEGFGQRWAVPKERAATEGPDLVLGVRPEKTRIRRVADSGGESGLNRVEGVVTDASFTGVSTQFLIRSNWGAEYQCFEQNLQMSDPIRRGDRVELVWDPMHSFGLDASEGIEAGLDSDVVEMATGRLAETAVGG